MPGEVGEKVVSGKEQRMQDGHNPKHHSGAFQRHEQRPRSEIRMPDLIRLHAQVEMRRSGQPSDEKQRHQFFAGGGTGGGIIMF